MAMLGRYRRRIATAALASLVAAGLPSLRALLLDSPQTLTRLASLVITVRDPHHPRASSAFAPPCL